MRIAMRLFRFVASASLRFIPGDLRMHPHVVSNDLGTLRDFHVRHRGRD
jgi:hypothetical protein